MKLKDGRYGGKLHEVHSPSGLSARSSEGETQASITPEAVRDELERVLASREFRASRRCQDFLRYVVEAVLTGTSDSLKERTIGIDVFGRPSSYETGEDATVRVKAGEVRKRLNLYYSANPTGTLMIDLPVGTYVPEFHTAAPQKVAREVASGSDAAAAASTAHSRWFWWTAGAVLALLAAGLVVGYRVRVDHGPTSAGFQGFWSPVLNEQRPVSLCAVVVPVYSRMTEPGPGEKSKPEDFQLVPDQFVAVGDLSSLLKLSEMFQRLGHPYQLRVGSDVTFRDVLSSPAVLVGFSYTKWDEVSRGFRYFIDMDRRPITILDNGKPTQWSLATHPDDPKIAEDYAIVSRVFDSDTHNILIQISGISHYGTEAATEFVTNPTLLEEAMRGAAPGWQKKNVQIVLHVKIIGKTPGVPSVVATHIW